MNWLVIRGFNFFAPIIFNKSNEKKEINKMTMKNNKELASGVSEVAGFEPIVMILNQ